MPSFVLITSLNLYFSREGKLLQVKQQEAEQNSFVGFVSFFANLQDYQGALQYKKYLRFIFHIVIEKVHLVSCLVTMLQDRLIFQRSQLKCFQGIIKKYQRENLAESYTKVTHESSIVSSESKK